MAYVGIPQAGWLDTVDELQSWQPGTDVYNRANLVPLKQRVTINAGPRLFIYHDMYGGYILDGDLYPQGTANRRYYDFNFWQYVDVFSYFTHHWLAVPPPAWINAAHRNGVPMLGNLTPPYGDSGSFVQPILDQPTVFVNQLIAIAQYYGFDGWAFNFETNLSNGATSAQQLVTFLQQLTQAIHAAIPGSQIIWYDSVTMQGYLDWQGELNSNNGPYFEACDGIFLDYRWTGVDPTLQNSAQYAGSRALDVYAGIQVFDQQYNTYQPLQTAQKAGVSGGLFANSWTYQQQTDADPFEKREHRLWIGQPPAYPNLKNCIGAIITERAVPGGFPFLTNFNSGGGRMFFISGSEVSAVGTEKGIVHWGNMSAQDVLPTYRNWISSGSPSAFESRFCSDCAYDGGTSMEIHSVEAKAGDSSTFTLFQVALTIPPTCTLSVTYRPHCSNPTMPLLAIILTGASAAPITVSVPTQSGTGWQTFTYDLSSNAGFVVNGIQVECTVPSGATEPVSVLIGELKLIDIAASGNYPQPVTGLEALNGVFVLSGLGSMVGSFDLVWDAPIDDTCSYSVYQVVSGPSYVFLGRAFTNAWNVQNVVFGTSSQVTLAVQPRNSYGYSQPVDQAATVTVNWSSAATAAA